MKKELSLLATLALCSASASAEVSPLLNLGVEAGGDPLVETTQADLNAGGGMYIGGGLNIQPEQSAVEYHLTLSYLFDSVEFKEPSGDASFNAMPLDFGVFTRHSKHNFGAGITYHLNPTSELCIDGYGCAKANFDDALGFLAQYNYTLNSGMLLGVKLTSLEYTVGSESIDASSLGVYIGGTF